MRCDVNKATRNGATPTFLAAANGHVGVVQALVESGADVDQATNDGMTPAFIAAYAGQSPVLEALIDAGADASRPNNDGTAPIQIAAARGHNATLATLHAELERQNALRLAAATRGSDAVGLSSSSEHVVAARYPDPPSEVHPLAAELAKIDPRVLSALDLTTLGDTLTRLTAAVLREQARRDLASLVLTEKTECVVCLAARREVAFACGHFCICSKCSARADVLNCPLCRAPITARQRIYDE